MSPSDPMYLLFSTLDWLAISKLPCTSVSKRVLVQSLRLTCKWTKVCMWIKLIFTSFTLGLTLKQRWTATWTPTPSFLPMGSYLICWDQNFWVLFRHWFLEVQYFGLNQTPPPSHQLIVREFNAIRVCFPLQPGSQQNSVLIFSTVSSGLNSLAAVVLQDFIKPINSYYNRQLSDQRATLYSKYLGDYINV